MEKTFAELAEDPRFKKAVSLFNLSEWYEAHDSFEELWHESNCLERRTLQAVLQVAVAEVHLSNGNDSGAIILYGEGLGRLRNKSAPDLGLDITKLCECVQLRLKLLQADQDPDVCGVPFLVEKLFLP